MRGDQYAQKTIDEPGLHANHFASALRAGGRTHVVRIDVRPYVFGWQVDLPALAQYANTTGSKLIRRPTASRLARLRGGCSAPDRDERRSGRDARSSGRNARR